MTRIGLIGFGYWGPNHIRIFNELGASEVVCCCDLDKANLEKVKKLYPDISVTPDYKAVAEDAGIDAVVIVTPLAAHYQIAKYCLECKKHVLMEKPFTATAAEAQDLIRIAEKNKLILMAGHVYKYNPGIIELKELIKGGKLGKLYYLKAERVGLGPIRKHVSALWDLATHDIYTALYLMDALPIKVYAHGASYIQKDIEDFVDLNLIFPGNVSCTIYASWFAPEKIRRVTAVGSRAMAVFDDVNKNEMLKVYEREIDNSLLNSTPKYIDHQHIVRMGNVYLPQLKQAEPLKKEAEEFLNSILKGTQPLSDGLDGLNTVRVLEAAVESLKTGGMVCL